MAPFGGKPKTKSQPAGSPSPDPDQSYNNFSMDLLNPKDDMGSEGGGDGAADASGALTPPMPPAGPGGPGAPPAPMAPMASSGGIKNISMNQAPDGGGYEINITVGAPDMKSAQAMMEQYMAVGGGGSEPKDGTQSSGAADDSAGPLDLGMSDEDTDQ